MSRLPQTPKIDFPSISGPHDHITIEEKLGHRRATQHRANFDRTPALAPAKPSTAVSPADVAPPPSLPAPRPKAPSTVAKPVVASSVANRDGIRHDFADLVRAPRRSFGHLAGMIETKNRLLRAGQAILGGTERNGILLFGEPGNGKTLFAEALAGQLGVPFLPVSVGDLASKWINETPEKIRDLFRLARTVGPCVLFLDEVDSLLKSRDGGVATHAMDRDVVNTLLTQIVGVRGAPIVLIAATNFVGDLDAAAIRAGRFDFHIEVPAPDYEARCNLIWTSVNHALGRGAIDRDLVRTLAGRWSGFSAARLSAFGPELQEMRQDGKIEGQITFEVAMQAMRRIQGVRHTLPEYVKRLDDIVMPNASQDTLKRLAFRLREAWRLEDLGGGLPVGVLFSGPPGTGKTMAAMALAKSTKHAFLSVTGADLLARPDTLNKLVRQAKDLRPAIVFIDEAESVLADRRHSGVAALTNQILTAMDGTGGQIPDVVWIAATNHPEVLDPAVTRGGRFSTRIHFDMPSSDQMFDYFLSQICDRTEELEACNGLELWSESGVSAFALELLAGRSIADADALLIEMINLAGSRHLMEQENDIRLRLEDVRSAARTVLGIEFERQ
jgi:transitional endoplasmic reticulum ATPase